MPIDPFFGTLATVGGSLLGGLIDSDAQESANQTNLQIAREKNELQEKLFNQQISNDWKMFDATNLYNNAMNQKARMMAAGFNPNMIFGSGLGSAQNISSPSAPNLSTAQVQPVNGFARALQTAIPSGVNTYLQAKQAEKAAAEATKQKIDNQFQTQLKAMELAQSGANVEAQNLLNTYNRETLQNRIDKSSLDNNYLSEQTRNVIANTALQEVQTALSQQNIKLSDKQIELLGEQINLAIQQGKTEISKQALNLSEKQYYDVMKVVEPILKRAQANNLNAGAEYSHSLAVGQGLQNAITQRYGMYQAYADAYNTYSHGKSMDEQLEIIKLTGKLLGKDLSTYDARLLLQLLSGVTKTVGNVATAAAAK